MPIPIPTPNNKRVRPASISKPWMVSSAVTGDVFMPCALGHAITGAVARRLQCRAICGAANNQRGPGQPEKVTADRGIVWVPDFLVNAGAVIEGVLRTQGVSRGDITRAWQAIEPRTHELLQAARGERMCRRGRSPSTGRGQRWRQGRAGRQHENDAATVGLVVGRVCLVPLPTLAAALTPAPGS